jgi:hypothetical protein
MTTQGFHWHRGVCTLLEVTQTQDTGLLYQGYSYQVSSTTLVFANHYLPCLC